MSGQDSDPREGITGTCAVCGQDLDFGEGQCDICAMAKRYGVTIEEVRLEVEDLAYSMTARFASAEGKPCTCGVGPSGGAFKSRAGGYVVYLDWDVRHETGCPRAPGAFDWPPIDEAERRRVFGYDGRTAHMARLASVLRQELQDREVLET